MKNNQIIYGVVGLLIGAALVWFGSNNTVNIQNSGMRVEQNQTMDAHFIEQMIPHHEDAITMAKLALEEAEHKEIKTLAQNIIDSQSSEINQMKNWYKDWFGKEVPQDSQVMNQHGMMGGKMHMGRMGDESDMNRLAQAENFDKVFIEEMIPHHQMAVMMANMLKNGTQKAEMKKLAQDIIQAQNSEINQMRQWYKDWSF